MTMATPKATVKKKQAAKKAAKPARERPEPELLLPSGGNDQWVMPFQHNLQRLGITMDVRQTDISQVTNRMRSRDYDMMPRLWRAMPWPSGDLQISWSSAYINSSYNAPGVASPANSRSH